MGMMSEDLCSGTLTFHNALPCCLWLQPVSVYQGTLPLL